MTFIFFFQIQLFFLINTLLYKSLFFPPQPVPFPKYTYYIGPSIRRSVTPSHFFPYH